MTDREKAIEFLKLRFAELIYTLKTKEDCTDLTVSAGTDCVRLKMEVSIHKFYEK